MKNKLTIHESFDVMTDFLTIYWEKTGSDDLGSLLGDMQLFADGSGTWDPAAWHDWTEALENKTFISPVEAFVATFNFLSAYHKRTSSSSADIQALLDEMGIYINHKDIHSKIWQVWLKCIEDVANK